MGDILRLLLQIINEIKKIPQWIKEEKINVIFLRQLFLVIIGILVFTGLIVGILYKEKIGEYTRSLNLPLLQKKENIDYRKTVEHTATSFSELTNQRDEDVPLFNVVGFFYINKIDFTYRYITIYEDINNKNLHRAINLPVDFGKAQGEEYGLPSGENCVSIFPPLWRIKKNCYSKEPDYIFRQGCVTKKLESGFKDCKLFKDFLIEIGVNDQQYIDLCIMPYNEYDALLSIHVKKNNNGNYLIKQYLDLLCRMEKINVN